MHNSFFWVLILRGRVIDSQRFEGVDHLHMRVEEPQRTERGMYLADPGNR